MPRYNVGFIVHEALFPSVRVGAPIDPLVVVRCFDNEYITTIKTSKTIVASWDEGCNWNNLELLPHAWNSGVIEFELQAANALWRNDTLGKAALQLKLVSTSKNSTFSGKIPLTAPNSVRVIGHLTVTVNAYDLSRGELHRGLPSVTKEYEVKPPLNLEIPPLTSPLIYRTAIPNDVPVNYKYFHLYINVYTLEDIEMEPFGFTPYITCEYAGCRLQTAKPIRVKGTSNTHSASTETNSLATLSNAISSYLYGTNKTPTYEGERKRFNFTFNQCFLIPISVIVGEPTLEDTIILRIWMGVAIDIPLINNGSSHLVNTTPISPRLLAEGVFSLAELRSQRQRAKWFNFYRPNFYNNNSIFGPIVNRNSQEPNFNASYYVGRLLLSASVRRIYKAHDVLKAHVSASHQLEPLSPSPTRIFSDVYVIESPSTFGFKGDFEVCLEITCGPFITSTGWHKTIWRKNMTGDTSSSLEFLGAASDAKQFGRAASIGWFCTFDSIEGRVPPLDLLISYSKDEQWYIFVRVLARSVDDMSESRILGSTRYSFEDPTPYVANNPKFPFWISMDTTFYDSTVPTFLNVLLTLEKQMFYSSSVNSSTNKDFRGASHGRRMSMINMDYELRCYIYSAKLPDITKDVAVSVTSDGKCEFTSARSQNTKFPVFMECLTMPVSIMTSPVSNLATPMPIMVSLVSLSRKEYISTSVTHYNCLITSKTTEITASKPKWLHLGDSQLLMHVELVPKSEAARVPKHQILPIVETLSFNLGLLGFRNLRIPNTNRNELFLKISLQNYGICTDQEQSHEFVCKSSLGSSWISNDRKNYDVFTVQSFEFKVPIEQIFDPHIELQLFSGDKTGNCVGYCSIPIHPEGSVGDSDQAYDLRYSMIPRKICGLLDSLSRKNIKDGYMFGMNKIGTSNTTYTTGVSNVLSEFEKSKDFKKMCLSLSLENVSVYVPPKMIIVADGKKIKDNSSLEFTLVADRNLDCILTDLPYAIMILSDASQVNRVVPKLKRSQESIASVSTRASILSTEGLDDSTDKPDTQSKKDPAGLMKYFLTINDKDGCRHRSYNELYTELALDSNQMYNAFRKNVKSSLYKLRFGVISSSNFAFDGAYSDLHLVVDIGGKENRGYLKNHKERLLSNIYQIYEREVFLPEDSQINIKVIASEELLTGDVTEHVLGSASIDLENRWFSKQWQHMIRKDSVPIEKILLYKDGTVQGYVNVIVQLVKFENFTMLRPLTFNRPPTSTVEVRLVIWSTRNVSLGSSENGKSGGMLDLYVVSRLDCQGYRGNHPLEQKTDIHYNCDHGNASFNWRIVYPEINTPTGACHLQLSVYDFWKVGAPIFIGEVNLELRPYIDVVSTTSNKVQIDGELPLCNAGKSTPHGFIQLSLYVLTQSEATAKPVGLAREEPNCNPHLLVPRSGRQWQDWLAHTGLSLDFSGFVFYIRIVGSFVLFLWIFFISFIYPSLLT
ncbi:hypothetical protein BEWA_004780 [Theileria equi strain WA]|uniref:C2 domain-containing protein n=1 Tax=Theileria equi strain WA TaxID=1537102 RepID=L0AZS5_THEEQ|nr:hypothetical protein BEWA_004780 [Theileria equi strain WA]AFZ81070.1 hypothetical protein BEWA_004780 [Theileria equi strain WA]|eukprot:XP_004830736.1 hypothetical protein BEWA_004780 [Theileria equi strain WA]